MLFLIHYDRNSGTLVSLQEFSENHMEIASSAKLELEISLLAGPLGHEVVLLEAKSRDDLKQTHRRYFESLQEMKDSPGGASEAVAERSPREVIIRRASMNDVADVQWLQDQVLSAEHKHRYAENIGVPGCDNYVACVGNDIVGFISVLLVVNNASGNQLWHRLAPYIGFVGVLPKFQRKGMCRLLVGRVQDSLRADGRADALYLECAQDKVAIYEKMGFDRLDANQVQQGWGVTPKSCVMRIKVI